MKKLSGIIAIMLLFSVFLCACEKESAEEGDVVYIYNWGDYVDPDTLDMFEEETGIRVVLDEFDTNETMYSKVESGSVAYDLLCPSDYMIQKMANEGFLMPLDWDQLPNAREYIGQEYLDMASHYDPGNKYAVPYSWGTLGIMYNTTMVDEEIDSWGILWDPKYKNDILMQDSVRDAFAVALILEGYSINTTDEKELLTARDLLMEQKELVQAYVVDEVRDKMVNGEAALGVVFSGEALMMTFENEDLDFVVPKEGTNLWQDSWVIPANAQNPENAHKFIDFMCRPDIALLNFEYLTYSTPNTAVQAMEEDPDYSESPIAFPDPSDYADQETYKYLGEDMDRLYHDLWIQVKSY